MLEVIGHCPNRAKGRVSVAGDVEEGRVSALFVLPLFEVKAKVFGRDDDITPS